MDDKQYWQQIFEAKKAEWGDAWIDDPEELAQAIQKQMAEGLSIQREKKQRTLTPEQQRKVSEYYKSVNKMKKQVLKTERYNFPTNLMDLKAAKKLVWSIIQELEEERGFTFQYDEHNKYALDQLTKYFIRDESFDGCLDKGIALVGDVGRGKTFIIEVFQNFTVGMELDTAFSTVDMKSISRDAQANGMEVIPRYTNLIKCFDDVGFEEKAKHFGNMICCFTELINVAYQKFVKTGKLMHITSNLAMDSDFGLGLFIDRYGERVNDRLKEMFNFIYLGGDSKRG